MSTTSITKEKRESVMVLFAKDSWQEFLYILKTISLVRPTVHLMLDDDSVKIREMDSNHIAMIEVKFDDIATEDLRCIDDTDKAILLDTHDLYKTLKAMKAYNDMVAVIELTRTSDKFAQLKVKLRRSSDTEYYDTFATQLEVNSHSDTPLPKVKMPFHFGMEADSYSYMIKTMNASSTTHIEMSGDASKETLRVAGVDLSSTRKAKRTSIVDLLSINESFGERRKACYDLGYMSALKYVDMFAGSIQVDLDVGKPIRIHTIPRLPFEMTYWVAPRVENS